MESSAYGQYLLAGARTGGVTVRFTPTDLPGVLIIEPDVYRDARGFFLETFSTRANTADGGIRPAVRAGQPLALGRRARCAACTCSSARRRASWCAWWSGEIFDVAVDVRRGSPTFGQVGRRSRCRPTISASATFRPASRTASASRRRWRRSSTSAPRSTTSRRRSASPGTARKSAINVAGRRAAALGARRAAADAQRRAPHPAALVRCALTPDR